MDVETQWRGDLDLRINPYERPGQETPALLETEMNPYQEAGGPTGESESARGFKSLKAGRDSRAQLGWRV